MMKIKMVGHDGDDGVCGRLQARAAADRSPAQSAVGLGRPDRHQNVDRAQAAAVALQVRCICILVNADADDASDALTTMVRMLLLFVGSVCW